MRFNGASNKMPVLGLLEHNGSVYVCTIPNARVDTLIPNYIRNTYFENLLNTVYFIQMTVSTYISYRSYVNHTILEK